MKNEIYFPTSYFLLIVSAFCLLLSAFFFHLVFSVPSLSTLWLNLVFTLKIEI
jgi:hypothetical protein